MQADPDMRAFSDLVGAIHDCALEPERWPEPIERIVRLVDASVGFIVLHDLQNNPGGRFFDHGIAPPCLDSHFRRDSAENPIATIAATREVGSVDTLATMFADDSGDSSAFNREWVRAQGLRDVLGVLVLRSGHRGGWLGTIRAEERGDFTPSDVETFRLLVPHAVRALRISDRLDLRSVTSDRLAEVLDALATPVFLVASAQRVVHRNEAAERAAPVGEEGEARPGAGMGAEARLRQGVELQRHHRREGQHVAEIKGAEGAVAETHRQARQADRRVQRHLRAEEQHGVHEGRARIADRRLAADQWHAAAIVGAHQGEAGAAQRAEGGAGHAPRLRRAGGADSLAGRRPRRDIPRVTEARPCPVCAKPVRQEHRPFCSARCRQVDLGRWLAGGYVVPGGSPEPEEEERARE